MSDDINYKMDKKGVIEILQSDEVFDWTAQVARELADEANHMQSSRQGGYSSYGSMAVLGSKDTLGSVFTMNAASERDNAKHHTLNAINH